MRFRKEKLFTAVNSFSLQRMNFLCSEQVLSAYQIYL